MKHFIAACLVLSILSCIDCMTLLRSGKEPFKSRKAPSETIRNYTIVQPVITGIVDLRHSKGHGGSHHPLMFTLTVNEVSVHLTLNKDLFPPHFTSKHFNEQGEPVISKGHVNCFYQGWVEGHPEWRATMSTCAGLKGSFGDSNSADQFFHIEPLDPTVTQQLNALGPHVLYLESEFKAREIGCGTPHSNHSSLDGLAANLPTIDEAKLRLKRQNSLGEKIVEWAVINDQRQFQQYVTLDGTVERSMELANYLDMLYREEYRIRIVLTYVETWNTGDRIAIVSDSSLLLDNFEAYSISSHKDSAMLFTSINLDGNTVGIANVRAMCRGIRSVGLTEDRGRSVESAGAIAAHELGHIFNMEHDDSPRVCSCSSGNCIMAAVSGSTPPAQWSSCSLEDLNLGFSMYGLDSCLLNEPAVILGEAVCGNGLREEGEVCDCGTAEICTDPCCNATSCQLVAGAECFSGSCCDSCLLRPYGTTCRESTQECDITEYCSGDSSECPDDFRFQDGLFCDNNDSYCFSGVCLSYDYQCQIDFNTNKGIDQCYSRNSGSDGQFGNCGHDPSQNQFLRCSSEDEMCGVLFCEPGDFTNPNSIFTTIITVSNRDDNGVFRDCRGSVTPTTSDVVNPGLVDEGTKCGDEMVCFQRRCVPLTNLNIPPCLVGGNGLTCSGNGICNNDNNCLCNVGFGGSVCTEPIDVPSEPSASASGGAIAGGIIGALLVLALIAGAVVATIVVIKFYKDGKYTPSHGGRSANGHTATKPVTSVSVVQPNKPMPSAARRPPPPTRPGPSRLQHTPPSRPPPSRTAQPWGPATKPPPPIAKPPPRPMPASRDPPPPYYANAPRPGVPAKPVPATRRPLVPPKP